MIRTLPLVAAAICIFAASPSVAGELYGGVYKHAVDTPFTLSTQEGGVDLQLGYRLDPEKAAVIGLLPPDLADKATAVGNTALQGAAALVAGTLSIQDLQDAASGAEERVLGNEEAFQRLYISYMNF